MKLGTQVSHNRLQERAIRVINRLQFITLDKLDKILYYIDKIFVYIVKFSRRVDFNIPLYIVEKGSIMPIVLVAVQQRSTRFADQRWLLDAGIKRIGPEWNQGQTPVYECVMQS